MNANFEIILVRWRNSYRIWNDPRAKRDLVAEFRRYAARQR